MIDVVSKVSIFVSSSQGLMRYLSRSTISMIISEIIVRCLIS